MGLTGLKASPNEIGKSIPIATWTPPKPKIKFRVRTGGTRTELDKALWTPLGGPFPPQTFPVDLTTVLEKTGHWLEVETWMYPNDDNEMPLLKGFDVEFEHAP